MSEWFNFMISSSILILVIVVLRALFYKRISMRLQYGLWLLAAVKLLAGPVPWVESSLSVQKLLEPCVSMLQLRLYESEGKNGQHGSRQIDADTRQQDGAGSARKKGSGEPQENAGYLQQKEYSVTGVNPGQRKAGVKWLSVGAAGAVVLFLYFLTGNLRFAVYLRRRRVRCLQSSCPLPVYLIEALPSPCLYGKAVYITPELASDEQRLSYVLLHEYCHYRQGDSIWSLLRCMCIVSCWWNPLVWVAAYLSKQDCELACDEMAMAYLGKEERLSYGRTLLSLITVKENPKDCFFIAATMMGGGRGMKRRIERIAHSQKSMLSVCILAVFLTGMCFVSVSTAKPASGSDQTELAEAGGENGRNKMLSADRDSSQDGLSAGKDSSQADLPSKKDSGQTDLLSDKDSSQTDLSAGNADTQASGRLYEDASDTVKAVMNLDEAIGQAVLSYNEEKFWHGECVAEGHIKLEDEKDGDGQVTVYALAMYGEYEFHDGFFIKGSGTGVIPVVMDFSFDEGRGYELKEYQMPMDGGYYLESVHEMFPEHLWESCLSVSDAVIAELEKQEHAYAKRYLKKIGRKASVGDYSDLEHPLLTDAGVSIEVSNGLYEMEKEKLWKYPDWIGNLERIEDGVRYVYEMALDKKAGEIVYTKRVYDTGEEVERYRIDMYTGEEL